MAQQQQQQQQQQRSFLSVSYGNLTGSEAQLATMWGAFNKCKPLIENGTRLENMSWRLWQYQRQPTNYIDNTTIKRFITSVLMSPVSVHDAYPHEVPQPTQKCYEPTTIIKSATSSFVVVDNQPAKADEIEKQDQDDQDDYEDDEDYYLSDDLYDDDDDDLYDDEDEQETIQPPVKEESQFIHDFKKTQPRPPTPRRSLLSDLLGRVSSPPPSLLSNSTCSFATTNSLIEDGSTSSSSSSSTTSSTSPTASSTTPANQNKHNNTTSKIALNSHPFTNTNMIANDPSEIRWRESFHGW